MSSPSDIEHGHHSHSTRRLRWQPSPERPSGVFRSAMNYFCGVDGAATEPFLRRSGHEAGNVAGLVTERLTVERVARLVDCDVASLKSLRLQLTCPINELPAEVKWNEDNIAKLISHCGHKVINPQEPEDMSLLHESVRCNAVDCAKQLFTYAADQGISVVLHWGEDDILGWALKHEQKTTAAYVLEGILAKCSTPSESARVIRKHFDALLKGIPRTMQKLIESDQFCFEYGRFQVPAEIFAMNAGASIHKRQDRDITITHSTDEIPWKAAEHDEVENFWKKNNAGFKEELRHSTGAQVTAVSKFICLNCPFHRKPRSVLSQLLSSECSVEMFKSTTVRMLVRWRWHVSAMEKQLLLLALHFICGILFLFFASRFDTATVEFQGQEDSSPSPATTNSIFGEDTSDLMAKPVEKSVLAICALVVWCALLFVYQPLLITYAISVTYIFFRCLFRDSHTTDSAFLTSLHCILILILISQSLRPFKLTGPFISMVHYTIRDIVPFLMLGAVTIATVGIAMLVSFATTTIKKEHEKDYDDFNSLLKAFETLFYAMLGTVEEDHFRTFSTNFLSIWRAILFNTFLILGAVVLISLLVAVLGDTFDRVMHSREAEFVKCRAVASEQGGFSAFYWVLSHVPLLRRFGAQPWNWFDADLLWLKCKSCFFCGVKSQKKIRRRRNQLMKLRGFEKLTHSDHAEQSQSSSDVLMFHFLVPADANVGKKKKQSSWQGRIFALIKEMESMFGHTTKSLETQSDSSREALTRVEKQVDAARERIGEAERRLQKQSESMQEQIGRMEHHLEALLGRMDGIEQTLRASTNEHSY